jgi:hypothetical protein
LIHQNAISPRRHNKVIPPRTLKATTYASGCAPDSEVSFPVGIAETLDIEVGDEVEGDEVDMNRMSTKKKTTKDGWHGCSRVYCSQNTTCF